MNETTPPPANPSTPRLASSIAAACLLTLLLAGAAPPQDVAAPASSPSPATAPTPSTQQFPRPPTSLRLELNGTVGTKTGIGLEIHHTFKDDVPRKLFEHEYLILLLDDQGRQVSPYPFTGPAVISTVDLRTRSPIYRPTIFFDPAILKDLKVGARYQIVVVVPSWRVAASTFFTLAD